jgi:HSP20 family protein
VLTISGEKQSETEDKQRFFNEHYYGRFERRIPVDDVDQENVAASFKNGVLTVTLPKLPTAQRKVKRIAIKDRAGASTPARADPRRQFEGKA